MRVLLQRPMQLHPASRSVAVSVITIERTRTVTRPRSSNRDLTSLLIATGTFLAVYLIGCHLAHAGVAAVDSPAGIDWTFWIALVSLVLGLASHVLHFVAPRTKTTVDDEWMNRVDTMLGWWQTAAPKPAPTLTVSSPRSSEAGFARRNLMALLAALGIPVLILACSMTQARQTAAVGVVSALDCEAAHLDAQAFADARTFAEAKVMQWLGGAAAPDSAKIRADLAPIKSDLGRCAIAAALAAATVLIKPVTPEAAISALASPTAAPAAVRAQFEIGARLAGWPPVQLAGGDVL